MVDPDTFWAMMKTFSASLRLILCKSIGKSSRFWGYFCPRVTDGVPIFGRPVDLGWWLRHDAGANPARHPEFPGIANRSLAHKHYFGSLGRLILGFDKRRGDEVRLAVDNQFVKLRIQEKGSPGSDCRGAGVKVGNQFIPNHRGAFEFDILETHVAHTLVGVPD